MHFSNKVPTTEAPQKSRTISRRIGSTDFEIAVFFSNTNKETLSDKIARLVKSEAGRGVRK
jgi:hypothetical protein